MDAYDLTAMTATNTQKPEIFCGVMANRSTSKQVGVAATVRAEAGRVSQVGKTSPSSITLQSLAQTISVSASQLSLQNNTSYEQYLR